MKNFPASIQPLIIQGFLDREFHEALRSRKGFRAVARQIRVPIQIGETRSETQIGLKTKTSQEWEHYTISMNLYAAISDLKTSKTRVSSILQNAFETGEQAARSLDELAQNTLFSTYLAGNTRITRILPETENTTTFEVDDIRGFQTVFVNGEPKAVCEEFPLRIKIGTQEFQAISVNKHLTNLSTTPGGISGAIKILSNEFPNVRDPVIATTAPKIIRPGQKTTTAQLTSGDNLTMRLLLDAVTKLRVNAAPEIDGAYNCYLDPVSARQLFHDPEFRQLFQGATSANQVFRRGVVNDFLGLRFIPANEMFVQQHPDFPQEYIRRVAICSAGALNEGVFPDMDKAGPEGATISMVNNVAMVTRMEDENTIAQSWYWIGGFGAPVNTNTGQPSRAVIIEHIG